jgi:excisionase family DNA binding protein
MVIHQKDAPMSEETLVYTVVEAGKLLGLTRNGSYEAVKKGSIPAIKIGKLIRVPKRALHAMLERVGE